MGTRKVQMVVCEGCKLAFEYAVSTYGGPQKKYCPECLKKRDRESQKKSYLRQKEKQRMEQEQRKAGRGGTAKARPREYKSKPLGALAKVNEQARERGMTYGQYVAAVKNERGRDHE